MRYVLLLRGINVGGKNKIAMADLRQQVEGLGYKDVRTYINSGNLFFNTDKSQEVIRQDFKTFFARTYSFVTTFSLISQADFQADKEGLPDWWQEDLARKDILFYTEGLIRKHVVDYIKNLPLGDEVVHFGNLGIYWGKYTESEYLKTAYHKHLLKAPFYKGITIRNGKNFEKIGDYLKGK